VVTSWLANVAPQPVVVGAGGLGAAVVVVPVVVEVVVGTVVVEVVAGTATTFGRADGAAEWFRG
jgi:hypothetical protein